WARLRDSPLPANRHGGLDECHFWQRTVPTFSNGSLKPAGERKPPNLSKNTAASLKSPKTEAQVGEASSSPAPPPIPRSLLNTKLSPGSDQRNLGTLRLPLLARNIPHSKMWHRPTLLDSGVSNSSPRESSSTRRFLYLVIPGQTCGGVASRSLCRSAICSS